MVLALVLAAALADNPSIPPRIDCATPREVGLVFQAAVKAYSSHDAKGAAENVERIVADCGDDPVTYSPRVMAAQLRWQNKDIEGARAMLRPVHFESSHSLFTLYQTLRFRLAMDAKDENEARDARSELFAASGQALTRAPINGKLVETFKVGDTSVTAYEAKFPQDAFIRYRVFFLTPANALTPLETIMVSSDAIDLFPDEDSTAYFIDEYTCWRHVTAASFSGKRNSPPTYEKSKDAVRDWITGKETGLSSTVPGGDDFCVWPRYVAPGLGSD